MANLIYNGKTIPIDEKGRISVTELYKASGQPQSKKPTRFLNSDQGQKAIKNENRGTSAWVSCPRRGTVATVNLACIYLEFIKDEGAAEGLKKVVETGKDVKYNSPKYTPVESPAPATVSSASDDWLKEGLKIIFAFFVIGAFAQQCQQPQTLQNQPSPPPSQYRPLSP